MSKRKRLPSPAPGVAVAAALALAVLCAYALASGGKEQKMFTSAAQDRSFSPPPIDQRPHAGLETATFGLG